MPSRSRKIFQWICATLLLHSCAQTPVKSVAVEQQTNPPVDSRPSQAAEPPQARPHIEHFVGRGTMGVVDAAQAPKIELELARSDDERQQGLMYRKTLADDHGMLFFMPYDNDWAFYMRNTYVRLDMVFIDADWRVVGVVENVTPLTEDHRQVGAHSRYVLELAAHQAAKRGIKAGTRLIYTPLPDAPLPARPSPPGSP